MPDHHFHITFLRHGQSEGNVAFLFQGQLDYPLTNLGRQQALALARRWLREDRAFDHIIASPLARAKETAQIIDNQFDIGLETDPLWMEQDFGEISNRNISEFARSDDRPKFLSPYQPTAKNGESRLQTFIRAGRAVDSILTRPPARFLVVSHGALLNMALYIILGITPQSNLEGPRFTFLNTAFATLSYIPSEHRWHLWGLNDHQHLHDIP